MKMFFLRLSVFLFSFVMIQAAAASPPLEINQKEFLIKDTVVSFQKKDTFLISPPSKATSVSNPVPCKKERNIKNATNTGVQRKEGKKEKFYTEKVTILFDLGKSEIKNVFFPFLNAFSKTYRGDGLLIIEGYTCPRGSKELNKKLGLARAEKIKQFFKEKGFSNIKTREKGGCCYLTKDPDSYFKNRRVEIHYLTSNVKDKSL